MDRTKLPHEFPAPNPEARLRLIAFHIAYNMLWRSEDCTVRFAMALIHSTQPIRNAKVLEDWWKWTRGRTVQQTIKLGRPCPESVRPILDAYVSGRMMPRAEAETTNGEYDGRGEDGEL